MTAKPKARMPRRRWILACVVIAVLVSAAGWFRLRVDSSLEPMLPEDSAARRTIIFLRDSSFAAKAVLWFELTGDGTQADLFMAADETEKRLDPSLVKRVIRPPAEGNALGEMMGLLDHVGELLGEKDLAELEKLTTPEALKKRMRECYMQLAQPQGSFLQQIIRRDPLGVNSRVLSRLYALTSSMGFNVEVKGGRFLHPDGRQLLLLFETPASATSLEGSAKLSQHLRDLVAAAPPNVRIRAMCAQMHTEQNDSTMRRDMNWAGTVDMIGFTLLFLIVCRDWRIGAVFFLPVVTIAITIGLCGLVYPPLSVLVIGLAATMAGSAVDYGIFVYTAIKRGGDLHEDLHRIRRHLLISLLSTMGVFVAFLFSNIPAYRQLGYLTCLSLVLSMLAAVFVLPVLIKPGGKIMAMGSGMKLRRWGMLTIPVSILALMLIVVGIVRSRQMHFDPDIARLDGVDPAVRQTEKDFGKVWSRNDTELAILAVSGKTLEDAEAASDRINGMMSPHFGDGQYVSLGSFWPSGAVRNANYARWQTFWTPERIAKLKTDLTVAGAPYGFSAAAFQPFFDSLDKAPATQQSREILASIEDQFISKSEGQWQVLSYFEDTPENIATAQGVLKGEKSAQVISRRSLGIAFADSASSETKVLVAISVAFIAISLLALTRSVLKSLLIMLPAVAGVVAMLSLLTAMGESLSVVSIIAAILIIGLCSDYGIFAVFSWDEDETIFGQGMVSMHLSSITTLIGTGSLLFAKHPALFLVGVSLTSGLLVGYLTAFFVVPGICAMLDRYWPTWGSHAAH